jgi:hypothetical protein
VTGTLHRLELVWKAESIIQDLLDTGDDLPCLSFIVLLEFTELESRKHAWSIFSNLGRQTFLPSLLFRIPGLHRLLGSS